MQVFSKDWFEKHQKKLVWFANTWFGRKVLKINKHLSSVGNRKIVCVYPSAIGWELKRSRRKIYYQQEFKTNNKYAENLYEAFKPFWWMLHFLDWLFIDRMIPKLSFGFDSLTFYPAAGANSPLDGFVYQQGAYINYSLIHNESGGGHDEVGIQLYVRLTTNSVPSQFYDLNRAITLFDTSSLPNDATISEGTWSFTTRNGKQNGLGEPSYHLCAVAPNSTSSLANSDYGTFGSTSFGSISYANIPAYNNRAGITLNASGIAAISLTGITKFGFRDSWDINNSFTGTWASSTNTGFTFFAADESQALGPSLLVTYTPAFTTYTQTEQSKARVKIVGNNKTVQGKARVKVTQTKTVQAKTRVKVTQTKTVQDKARIKKAGNDKTEQSKVRIKNTVPRTVQAVVRIFRQGIDQTSQAKTRIKITQTKATSTKAKIVNTGMPQVEALVRIHNVLSLSADVRAAIQRFALEVSTSAKVRIKKAYDSAIFAKVRIFNTLSKTAQAKVRIHVLDQSAEVQTKAAILNRIQADVWAKVRILKVGNDKSEQSKARIKISGNNKTSQAKAYIINRMSQVVTVKAAIWNVVTRAAQAKVRIKNLVTKTVQAGAAIIEAVEKWTPGARTAATWSKGERSSATFSATPRTAATWSKGERSSATFSATPRTAATWSKPGRPT
jgi:hypothetical protein